MVGADPEVAEALAAARGDELHRPTLGPAEPLDDLLADALDVDAAGSRGHHVERLDQLALEHLRGAR